MCGIVAAVAQRDVAPILIAGLKALEYRGYDSAGIAVLEGTRLHRIRAKGKVCKVEALYTAAPFAGGTGIAHTRWATHGVPSEGNAHPHVVGRAVVVHNGIIENHAVLRAQLKQAGRCFESDTDTEVIAHLIDNELQGGAELRAAVQTTVQQLQGAFAIAVLDTQSPDQVFGARHGSPLVVGIGIGEHFLASDVQALIQVTRKVMYLEQGDLVQITRESVQVYDAQGHAVERRVQQSECSSDAIERGEYRHYMLKEIFEQPRAVAHTLQGRLGTHGVLPDTFGAAGDTLLRRVRGLHIVACGTSYHAALVARYWIESLAGLPVSVEVASEYRYRDVVVPEDTLFVAISQSGETADTLSALRESGTRGYLGTLGICNVPESSLVRTAELKLMTRAGPEIGVASTKAFTTQLTALALLALELGRQRGVDPLRLQALAAELAELPRILEQTLACEDRIKALAERFVHHQHALFLGRGVHFAVALEAALKLKEISYIHAEAYPSGELKHGPLALVDENMPVVAVAPPDALLEKLKANLQEVRARGGQLYVLCAAHSGFEIDDLGGHVLEIPVGGAFIAPAVFTVPLQLLAYHVAVLRGTDVDQPRNLAKSVTVE